MKVSVYIATSLDGFIARRDGSLDWLDEANTKVPEGEDLGFHAFIESIDVLVMGRKTFEQVLSFGNWIYGSTRVVVLSRRPMTFSPDVPDSVVHSSEKPCVLYDRLRNEGAKHVYVDGGLTLQSFLTERLIDEITVTQIPVLLGDGKSLFGRLDKDIGLDLIESKSYSCGFVQSKYAIQYTRPSCA